MIYVYSWYAGVPDCFLLNGISAINNLFMVYRYQDYMKRYNRYQDYMEQ